MQKLPEIVCQMYRKTCVFPKKGFVVSVRFTMGCVTQVILHCSLKLFFNRSRSRRASWSWEGQGAVSSRSACRPVAGTCWSPGVEGSLSLGCCCPHLLRHLPISCLISRPCMTTFPVRMTYNHCWPGLRSWRKPTSTWSGKVRWRNAQPPAGLPAQ